MKNILNQLERKIGRHYIHDLMKYLTLAMLGVFVLEMLPLRSAAQFLRFDRAKIFKGEIWRAFTYVLLPPGGSMLMVLISLYFYFFLGSSLERSWGGARFNLFCLLGYVCTLAAGFLMGSTTNHYFFYSMILCFAMLYPNQEFLLFFILPVKVKWIGILDALMLVYFMIVGTNVTRVVLLFSMIPFFLFFGKDVWLEAKLAWRRLQYHINQHR